MNDITKRSQQYVLAKAEPQIERALVRSSRQMEFSRDKALMAQQAIADLHSGTAWQAFRTVRDMAALRAIGVQQGMSPQDVAALDVLLHSYVQNAAHVNDVACQNLLRVVAEMPDLEPNWRDRLRGGR